MARLLTIAPALALLASLAPAAPVPRGADKPVLYFPTQVGAKWVYRGTSGPTAWEDTRVVTAVRDDGAAKVVTVGAVHPDGTVAYDHRVAVSPTGLFRLGTSGTEFRSPMCLIKLPSRAGDSW